MLILKKFIDFDKNRRVFYNNLWLDDQKVAIKIPILEENLLNGDLKIEKFDLAKYTFLLTYY